jgi:hypothetical protein
MFVYSKKNKQPLDRAGTRGQRKISYRLVTRVQVGTRYPYLERPLISSVPTSNLTDACCLIYTLH